MNMLYIFGIGSPFGDDSIGWTVIDDLEKSLEPSPNIYLEKLSNPSNIFIHDFDESDFIIFIDAVISGAKPGTIHTYAIKELPDTSKYISTHGLNLKTSVDLLLGLGLSQNQILIIGIEALPLSHLNYISGIPNSYAAPDDRLSVNIIDLIGRIKSHISNAPGPDSMAVCVINKQNAKL